MIITIFGLNIFICLQICLKFLFAHNIYTLNDLSSFIISNVDLPIDPVEPNIAIFFFFHFNKRLYFFVK